MKAIILVGGMGKRLGNLTGFIPKPMLPVSGRPFLEIIIKQLKKAGIKDIILATGHRSRVVKSYFSDGKKMGVNIAYSEELKPRGTGGALMIASEKFKDSEFLALNGDSFFDLDIKAFLKFHIRYNALVSVALTKLHDVSRYGCVKVGKDGGIEAFCEKGIKGSGLINTGIYILNKGIFRDKKVPFSLEKDIIGSLSSNIKGFVSKGYFIDIGVPKDYLKSLRYPDPLKNKIVK